MLKDKAVITTRYIIKIVCVISIVISITAIFLGLENSSKGSSILPFEHKNHLLTYGNARRFNRFGFDLYEQGYEILNIGNEIPHFNLTDQHGNQLCNKCHKGDKRANYYRYRFQA
ncbi:hypothetical protein LJ707_06405 [Mucilaginibacter sp. UR6-1]|uniref:hypothetical protein n=1 Tax=Mucilaginibacter sp. UR6-1 TaxID=1435643 RepID=UPI001E41E893|nr:hypothetical protein [Mucilaginibacter sp. UR6-1]MCC8408553.1 hypothetical protein [Mucilaginibacter sp. UR6-1]